MTDELSIQPQVIQQKKNDNSALWGAGGLVGGAAAGYGINRWVQKPMSHEDIIKDANANDRAEFSSKYEKEATTWKEVQEQADKVKKLKDEANNVADKIIPETEQEAIDLKNAIEKRDNEFARLVEEAKANGGSSKIVGFPTREQLRAKLTSEDYSIIRPYAQRYEAAKKSLLGNHGSGGKIQGQRNEVASTRKTIKAMYDGIFASYDKLSDKAKGKDNVIENNFGKRVDNTVDTILPKRGYDKKPTTLAEFEQLIEKHGAELYDISDEKVSGAIKVQDAKGKNHWVTVNKDAVAARREALKTEYLENIRQYIDRATELKGYDKEFFEANKEALANDLIKPIKDVKAMLAEISGKELVAGQDSLKSFEVLQLALDNGTQKFPVKMGSITIKNQHQFDVIKQQAEAQVELCKKYIEGKNAITLAQTSIINQDSRMVFEKAKLRKAIAEDSGVENALKAIEKLNGKYASEEQKRAYAALKELLETSELSQSEIEANVRKMMEGGRYETVKGLVRRIDENKKLIIMEDQTVIPAEEVVKIEG